MSNSSGDPVATISENEATGTIKAIYDDIKAVLGVPVVNLIFRHIAIMPGCLQWSWDILRPLYAGQELNHMAEQLMADLPFPARPRLAPVALRAVGVNMEAEHRIRQILDAYNRSNPINLLALSALLAALQDGISEPTQGDPLDTRQAFHASRQTPSALPPLLALDDMDVTTATLVRRLNGLGAQGEARTMASMYRQLAHWPGYLALALTLLQPLHADGRLERAASHAQHQAALLVRRILSSISTASAPASLSEASRQNLTDALQYFTANLIVEMLPVGKLLRDTLPQS